MHTPHSVQSGTLPSSTPSLRSPPRQVLEVMVEEGEVGAAEALLRFMYTGGLEPAVVGSVAELLQLLRLADRFQVGAAALAWAHP